MKKRVLRIAVIAVLVASPVWADVLIQGFSGVKAEVDANTRALRATLRPNDVGSLGAYSVGNGTGTIAAGMAAGGTVYSFRWTHATNVAVIERISIGASSLGTGFTAGTASCWLDLATSFTASDTGGNAVTVPKKRNAFGSTLVGDIRISNTAALTPGTRTVASSPLRFLGPFTVTTAVQTNFIPVGTLLWDQRPGDWPLVLAQNEGFLVNCTVPATGTWTAVVSPEWREMSAY